MFSWNTSFNCRSYGSTTSLLIWRLLVISLTTSCTVVISELSSWKIRYINEMIILTYLFKINIHKIITSTYMKGCIFNKCCCIDNNYVNFWPHWNVKRSRSDKSNLKLFAYKDYALNCWNNMFSKYTDTTCSINIHLSKNISRTEILRCSASSVTIVDDWVIEVFKSR